MLKFAASCNLWSKPYIKIGLFIGDAVSMPVHWYYDVTMIKFDFKGWISKYESPKDQHPTSILKISNTGSIKMIPKILCTF